MKKILTTLLLFNMLALSLQGVVNAETGVTPNLQNPVTPASATVNSETAAEETKPTDETPPEPPVKNGWVEEGGKTFYFDPNTDEMKKGWVQVDGIWYYFHLQSGEMQTGWILDKKWYYLNENGEMQTGWITDQNKRYYLTTSGAMQTGWVLLEGTWYYFDPQAGDMKTGWVWDKKWYYLNEKGEMQTGWVLSQNKWYYLNTSGAMMTGWVFVQNNWYFLEKSGAMKSGWLYDQNNWYYLTHSGAMATGWYIVDHIWYYSYSSGAMAKNTWILGYYVGNSGAWIPDLVNPKQNYSYSDLGADLKELQETYPGFVRTESIGKSVDGRNIYALKLGIGEKEIFFNGSHHAREHMTTNLLMEMIDQYAVSYARNGAFNGYNVRQLLNKVSIWFVPMVNPDGVMLVQEGAYTAKNPSYVLALNGGSTDFSAWKANVRGVDLNRQYPADWEAIRDNSGYPGPSHFKGYQPLSEPEVQAITNFTKAHPFKIAVAYHSSGRILYWDYKQAAAEKARDYQIALKYSKLTGYSLVSQGSNPSGGGYTDWFIQAMKLPGFTPEISPYTYNKPVPIANFDSIWRENQAAGLLMAQEALKF